MPQPLGVVQAVCTTNQPCFDLEAWAETKLRVGAAVEMRSLAPGIRLIGTAKAFSHVAAVFRENPPVFIRHLCPASVRLDLTDGPLVELRQEAARLTGNLDRRCTFSIQSRLYGHTVVRRYEANECIAATLKGAGYALDVRQPEQIISVQIVDTDAYIGVSRATDNLSDWAGGECRFRRDEGQISRAEFKLLEAIRCFGISLPRSGRAIDLGAAPGGWSRILLDHGLSVVAVDPAELDCRVRCLRGLEHLPVRAQDSLQLINGLFEVLVSDMRMDAVQAARVISRISCRLKRRGHLLATMKLPRRNAMGKVLAATSVLRREFDLLGVRQLFHNRSEVTVFGLKR